LGKLGGPRAIEPLIERLDDEDLSVQQDAQLALSQFDREDAKEALSYAML
jgi:HEAT repeat protein